MSDSTAVRQANGKLNELFAGLETKEARLKLLKFETNLLKAIGLTGQELLEEKQDSKFLSALMQLGSAYAALKPTVSSSQQPLNFFLNTLWNAQSEMNSQKGATEFTGFAKDAQNTTKLLQFEQHLLEVTKQSNWLNTEKQDPAFIKGLLDLGKAHTIADPTDSPDKTLLSLFLEKLLIGFTSSSSASLNLSVIR